MLILVTTQQLIKNQLNLLMQIQSIVSLPSKLQNSQLYLLLQLMNLLLRLHNQLLYLHSQPLHLHSQPETLRLHSQPETLRLHSQLVAFQVDL
jgi:hypothetical protein